MLFGSLDGLYSKVHLYPQEYAGMEQQCAPY